MLHLRRFNWDVCKLVWWVMHNVFFIVLKPDEMMFKIINMVAIIPKARLDPQ